MDFLQKPWTKKRSTAPGMVRPLWSRSIGPLTSNAAIGVDHQRAKLIHLDLDPAAADISDMTDGSPTFYVAKEAHQAEGKWRKKIGRRKKKRAEEEDWKKETYKISSNITTRENKEEGRELNKNKQQEEQAQGQEQEEGIPTQTGRLRFCHHSFK